MTSLVWNEAYRPKKVDDTILPEHIKKEVKSLITNGNIPNLLFTGSAGVGKTTLARAMAHELGYVTLLINASDEGRFLDTFRNRVAQFCSGVSIDGSRKMLIIDEADNLTHDAQSLLRNFIEKHSKNCSFVMTANFPAKLMEPIRSRFSEVQFKISNDDKANVITSFFARVRDILEKENVTYDVSVVAKVVNKFFPDFRRTLNELQRYSASGTIDSGIFAGFSGDLDQLIDLIKEKRWELMRKWVAEQSGLDFTIMARTLYNRANEFIKLESKPQLVLLISEYDYRNQFVQDREINTVAFLTQVMNDCETVK